MTKDCPNLYLLGGGCFAGKMADCGVMTACVFPTRIVCSVLIFSLIGGLYAPITRFPNKGMTHSRHLIHSILHKCLFNLRWPIFYESL